ncbi:MAG TPA: nucleotide sugar dehydrogenase [Dehalococcoidia bacterium]|nr:nucleotide sugar dehydrogenase [Dehalococcoidia bacterium]
MLELEEKIRDKSARIGIVGLGYVGLPLALGFCQAGFKVLGVDIQRKRVDAVNRGQSYIADVPAEQLEAAVTNNLLWATTEQGKLRDVDAICICVPTPLTRTKQPDLSHVTHESREISRCLQPGQLVILESTTYPGTTREVVLPILESSNLRGGTDFYLAYSPERIDPGNRKYSIRNTPKVVGGINPKSTELARLLYSAVVDTVVPVSCPEVAEMTKVFENVFRSVNIALVNELAQLCHKLSISVWEVIHAASTKPFGYMPFYPGPGIGGHCVPLDPYYLADKAREFNFRTRFIELAADINEHMPDYTATCIMETLNARGKSLKGAQVLVMGVTYKKDIADIRESPSLKLIQLLRQRGARISYHDPYIPQLQLFQETFTSIELTEENLSAADCVIIATNHSCYNLEQIVACSKLVFDTRGATCGLTSSNVVRLGE